MLSFETELYYYRWFSKQKSSDAISKIFTCCSLSIPEHEKIFRLREIADYVREEKGWPTTPSSFNWDVEVVDMEDEQL